MTIKIRLRWSWLSLCADHDLYRIRINRTKFLCTMKRWIQCSISDIMRSVQATLRSWSLVHSSQSMLRTNPWLAAKPMFSHLTGNVLWFYSLRPYLSFGWLPGFYQLFGTHCKADFLSMLRNVRIFEQVSFTLARILPLSKKTRKLTRIRSFVNQNCIVYREIRWCCPK